jgi:hypothetical protein
MLAQAGRTNRRGIPPALQMAVLVSGHLDEMAAPVVPLVVQRAMLNALAAIGGRRGYRFRTSSPSPVTRRLDPVPMSDRNAAVVGVTAVPRPAVETTSRGSAPHAPDDLASVDGPSIPDRAMARHRGTVPRRRCYGTGRTVWSVAPRHPGERDGVTLSPRARAWLRAVVTSRRLARRAGWGDRARASVLAGRRAVVARLASMRSASASTSMCAMPRPARTAD